MRAGPQERSDHRAGPLARPFHLLRPAVRVDLGAGGDGVRQVGERGALLGVDRAAHPAVPGAQALPDVAADRIDVPAELLAAVVDGAVVRIGVLVVDLADPEPLLHFLEVRPQHLGGQRQPFGAAPVVEDGVRRAVARGPVHDRPAAYRAPLQHLHREVRGRPVSAVLVEARKRRRLLHVELVLGVVAAFLEDHHAGPRSREPRSHHRAPRTAADDADVGPDHDVPVAFGVDHRRDPSTDFTSS